jgi:nitrogenase-associated protein
MAFIIFFTKPGCVNGIKQQEMLWAAGHVLEVHNLLEHPWSREELLSYFGDRPVHEWFNRAAPRVKSGEVVPEQVDAEGALAMMVADPLLIRRPLLRVDDRREVGFDQERIHAWIGLTPPGSPEPFAATGDLQSCPQMLGSSTGPCPSPEPAPAGDGMTMNPMAHRLLDLTIADLARQYPDALQMLIDNGCAMIAEPENLRVYGPILRLRTLLRSHRIDPDVFCSQLTQRPAPIGPEVEQAVSPNLNLFALLPCPLKVPLEEAFLAFSRQLPPQYRGLSFMIEGNANNQLDYADYADHFHTLDEMPDIIITPGFNSFFHRPFVERFITTGKFRNVNDYAGDRHLAPLGVIDPEGHYTMLAMNLLVLVANHARLGARPVPQRWADLLEPHFSGSIAIRGNRDGTFCETLLLTIHKEFGTAGLEQLGRNVRYGWHPSQMVKAAVSGGENAPAISVMPLFFANTLKGREGVSIIWPEDGTLVSPVTMLVKAEKRDALREVVDFLAGPEVARICAGAFFPAVHPAVDNRLPENATFKWIGWDYVKDNDLKALIAATNDAFLASFQGKTP